MCHLFKTTIKIVVIITSLNKFFNTHTHAYEFMASKILVTHKKLWHAMKNIGAINSRRTKI